VREDGSMWRWGRRCRSQLLKFGGGIRYGRMRDLRGAERATGGVGAWCRWAGGKASSGTRRRVEVGTR